MSLNAKLLRVVLWVAVIWGGAFVLTYSAYQHYKFQRDYDRMLEDIKLSYTPALTQAAWNFDEQQARLLIQSLLNFPHLEAVEFQAWPLITLAVGQEITAKGASNLGKASVKLELKHIILEHQGEVVGNLTLGLNREGFLDEMYWHQGQILLFGLFFVLVLLALLIWLTTGAVIKPINRLVKQVERISLDDLTHGFSIPNADKAPNELKRICDGLNTMRERLLEQTKRNEIYRKELEKEAQYDSLTKLPNRKKAHRTLEEVILRKGEDDEFFVALIDFANFKSINDSFGMATGDRFLVKTAQRLKDVVGRGNFVARFGVDQFLLIFHSTYDSAAEQALSVALEYLSKPTHMPFVAMPISLRAFAGVAVYPYASRDAETLIKCAEDAAYAVRDTGGIRVYDQQIQQAYFQHSRIKHHLPRALAAKELSLHYQPLVDGETLKPRGLEALIRWNSIELGRLSPELFIGVAEKEGLIQRIESWVLHQACQDIQTLDEALGVSVNISYLHFREEGFVDFISNLLKETGLTPQRLELEITERVLILQPEKMAQKIEQLKQLGVKIAIDDFGTGYSALSYLRQFAFDTLKIDRSFIGDMLSGSKELALVTNIIQLAHDLGIKVVAEGVELDEQLDKLRALGCDRLQGFYFSRPQSLDDIKQELERLSTRSG